MITKIAVLKHYDRMISIIGATHPGLREHNEDCFIADSSLGLGLVADGMGGYACGEVASQLVQRTVQDAVSRNEGLQEAIARAHVVVQDAAAADDAKRGMGSTAIALKVQGLDYEIAWVGDSRAYLWSRADKKLKQITRDHSYVETLLSSGAITQQEAINHPNRNLITQAVGVAGDDGLNIDVVRGRLAVDQQLILCSDGLVDEVLDRDIAHYMTVAVDPAQALDNLIQAAVTAGGRDNITVVIATVNGQAGDEVIDNANAFRSALSDRSPAHSNPVDSVESSPTGSNEYSKFYANSFIEAMKHHAVIILAGITLAVLVGVGLFYFS